MTFKAKFTHTQTHKHKFFLYKRKVNGRWEKMRENPGRLEVCEVKCKYNVT